MLTVLATLARIPLRKTKNKKYSYFCGSTLLEIHLQSAPAKLVSVHSPRALAVNKMANNAWLTAAE
jgi:hypothetical protein